jgi:hypothetical protein
LAIGEQELPREEEIGAVEMRREPPSKDPLGNIPQSANKKQGRPKLAVKYKKVTSRKKAGEQARTMIVSVPKEEEEIVDVKVRQPERGRPRKPQGRIHRTRARGVFQIPVRECARTL